MFENLEQLIKTIRERKNSSPDKSYTNKLLNDKRLSVSKVKEEIGELIESVDKNSNKTGSYLLWMYEHIKDLYQHWKLSFLVSLWIYMSQF